MSAVRCAACDRTLDVDIGACLLAGWPTCHGQTMGLTSASDEELEAAGAAVAEGIWTRADAERVATNLELARKAER